jgi:hypothetical protein
MAAVLTHARYDFPSLDELQQTYNKVIGKATELNEEFNEWLKKNERKVEEISFNNKTKELTLTYNDGTIERYIGAEVAATSQKKWSECGQLEITYNFKDFNNDGKYVEDFGENNE